MRDAIPALLLWVVAPVVSICIAVVVISESVRIGMKKAWKERDAEKPKD
jgi:phosphate/sulfate permease